MITSFAGDDTVRVHFAGDEQPASIALNTLPPQIRYAAALCPV